MQINHDILRRIVKRVCPDDELPKDWDSELSIHNLESAVLDEMQCRIESGPLMTLSEIVQDLWDTVGESMFEPY